MKEIISNEELEYAKRRFKEIAKDHVEVNKRNSEELLRCSSILLENLQLTELEKSRIYGLELAAYYDNYAYQEAEKTADLLNKCNEMHPLAYCTLAEYYGRTRRYSKCQEVLDQAIEHYPDFDLYSSYMEQNNRRISCAQNHQIGEYLPNPQRNREEMVNRYLEFIQSLGIEPTKIYSKAHYESKIHHRYDPNFNTFIAFDFETSGLSYKTNSPIEIGAIKVINGKVIENQEYIFQELMKPKEGSVSNFITELTGITNEDLKNAREMENVMSDFFEWAGDLPIIGYNSRAFDTLFLSVCAEACDHTINNEHFDVIIYARNQLRLENYKLCTVADHLKIINPRAHRALGDAITTSKVFLKIKKKSPSFLNRLWNSDFETLYEWGN